MSSTTTQPPTPDPAPPAPDTPTPPGEATEVDQGAQEEAAEERSGGGYD